MRFLLLRQGLLLLTAKTTVRIIIIWVQFFRLEIAIHTPFFAAISSSRRAFVCGMIRSALINPAKQKDDKFYK